MKKYFNAFDYTVLSITLISFIWIIFYKFSWDHKEELFNNASKVGDITYGVFSSLVAAGIFYIVTVYLPKYLQIKMMIKLLPMYVKNLDRFSELAIILIVNKRTNENYTTERFKAVLKQNNDNAKNDFINCYSNDLCSKTFYEIVNLQKNIIQTLILNYSNSLPKNISIHLIDFCNINYSTLEITSSLNLPNENFQKFIIFEQILKISDQLKQDYNINI